ncbi:hypothetical protein KKC94_00765 [Patescibacteria group bacterium]|nr:hypothetical protein [Patescibacteria group bacterium]
MTIESFFGLEEGESQGSAEAAEKFREQLKKNATAIKAMTGHQKKQKKKEEELAKILTAYIKDQSKSDMVFLIIRLLQENIPGAFILAVLLISDSRLEHELKVDLKSKNASDTTLTSFAGVASLPENVKAELNAWGDEILKAGLLRPTKTLESVLTPEHKLKSIVLDLIDYALEEYFERISMKFSEDKIRQFALLSIQSVLIKLKEEAKKQTDIEIIETPIE